MSALRLLAAPVAAAIALAALAIVAPAVAARGWLIGFVVASTPVLGALALTLVARLTGGRWGARTEPFAAAAPALLILFLVLWLAAPGAYPWVANRFGPGHAPDYLGPALFGVRSLVGLAIWSALALLLVRGSPSRLTLGVGLLAHAVLVILLGVDWILSLQPGWMASDFGMNLAAQQIAAGAAVAILIGGDGPDKDFSDLTTLVIAGVLGVAYLGFMDYLVVWYGDLPDKVGWYLVRGGLLGRCLAVAALLVGAAGPPIIRALPRLPIALKARLAAVAALAGLVAYQLFLLLTALGWAALGAAALSLIVQAGALAWVAGRLRAPGPARRLAHG